MDKSWINLQLFADGAGGDGGAGAGDAGTGVTGQGDAVPVYDRAQRQRGLSGVRYEQKPTTTQPEATLQPQRDAAATQEAEPPKARPTFQQLIEGEYKDDYSKHTQEIVKARLKTAKAAEERLTKLSPALETLASRYGLDMTAPDFDPDALVKAIDSDQSLYEAEALEKGMTTQQLMREKQLEREVAQARAIRDQQQREAQIRAQFENLRQQGEAFKQNVPEFDLAAEMQNETFARLTMQNFPVENAYYAAHYAEIEARRQEQQEAQMREVAKNAQQAAAAAVRSNARRPTENGTNNAQPAGVRSDPSQLKLGDFKSIRERVRRGEAIGY